MKRNTADVAIIGAGVIGLSIARELASRGMHVIVIDRATPGRAATWAAAGMLSPLGEAHGTGAFLDLADDSLRRYARFARELNDETGIDVEYRTNGTLHVSIGDVDDELSAIAASPAAARFDVAKLDSAAARNLEPALSDSVTGALLVGRDHRVNNRLLAQALLATAIISGADVRTRNQVISLIVQGDAIAGVRLASGEDIAAETVVLSAGAWSGDIDGLPRPLPIRPVRGQMFAVDRRVTGLTLPFEPAIQRVVLSRLCYIIPRDDGRLLVGATVENVGFLEGPTPGGIAGLMRAAASVAPLIDDLPLVETWSGFRPTTPDDLPVIGRDPDLRGLVYATGHFRNGILLAPVTAECVAAVIAGEPAPADLSAFSVSRFERTT